MVVQLELFGLIRTVRFHWVIGSTVGWGCLWSVQFLNGPIEQIGLELQTVEPVGSVSPVRFLKYWF